MAVRMKSENPSVSKIAMSRLRHQDRLSSMPYATLRAFMIESMPLEAPRRAASTLSDRRLRLAPLTTESSVRLSSDAASSGSTRSA
jgi:hypothetical protein